MIQIQFIPPMLALLRYEPQDRPSIEDALAMIEWVDHRREGGGHEDADGNETEVFNPG